MSRQMYDAVTVSNIPGDALMVAGYVDGGYVTVPTLERRFPRARIVRITVLGSTLDAHVADVETGDLTPDHGAQWAMRKHQAGQHPTLYCNSSTWGSVIAACHRIGLDTAKDVSWWIAQYDGHAVIPNGATAKQFTDKALGRDLDESIVSDYWPGVDPIPTPHATPTPAPIPTLKGKRMFIIRIQGTAPQFITDGITRRWIEDPAERQILVSLGVVPDAVHDESAEMVNRIPLVGKAPA